MVKLPKWVGSNAKGTCNLLVAPLVMCKTNITCSPKTVLFLPIFTMETESLLQLKLMIKNQFILTGNSF